MKKYTKNYLIEWLEECEANSFEEAEEIMDKMAENNSEQQIQKHHEVELVEE